MTERPEDVSDLPASGADAVPWGRALSWAFYDFANTIYSALVVSYAIALHVKEFTGVEKFTFLTMAASLLASGLVLPLAGELTDRTGRTKRCLVALTIATCAACAAISAARTAWVILGLFFVANFGYNASLTFYDSLLPTVTPRRSLGLVSGIGVGLGYAGVAFALPLGDVVVRAYRARGPEHELAPLFAVAGGLFLCFSLPLFVWVPEKAASKPGAAGARLVALAARRVAVTLRALPRHRSVLLFLIGNFLCVDALNACIFAYAPYVVNVFGLTKRAALLWMIPFSLGAFGLGAIGGRLCDAFGSRFTLLSAGICMLGAIVLCSVAGSFAVFMVAFVLLGGYGLATTWVAGRKMLVELVPSGQVGKFFGLYNLGHKLSMIGMVAFGLLADLSIAGIQAGGYRVGLLVQVVLFTVGMMCIYKVEMPRETDG